MKTIKTRSCAILLSIIALTLCAALCLPTLASDASSAIAFDVIQQVNSATYAASAYADIGMKAIEDASSICVVGEKVYYFDDFGYYAPYTASLYVSNLNGSGKKLLAEYTGGYAFYLGAKIYYDGATSEEGRNSGIYCLDVSAGKSKKIVANGDIISIYDDTIYYRSSTKGGVYSCALNGGKKKLFSNLDGYDYGIISDGKYFAKPDDDNSIYVLDLKSPARYDRVAYADEYSYFIVDSGYMYYVRDKALYKCKTDAQSGSGEVKLCAISAAAYGAYPIKVVGNKLYFIEDIDKNSANTFLYKVSVNGGTKTFTGKSWFVS